MVVIRSILDRLWVFACLMLFIGCGHNDSKEISFDRISYIQATFSSEVLKRDIPYNVFYPLGYELTDSIPIIYLLHGHGGDREDWFQKEEGNVNSILDSLIHYKAIPPVIAVSISAGNSWYVDSQEAMESFYLSEFIPHLDERYRLKPTAKRIIAGNSAGGYGSLRFALKQPELFDHVILLSPASYEPVPPAISSSRKIEVFAKNGVFNDSVWNSYSYKHLVPAFIQQPKLPDFYLSVGDDDAYNIVLVVTELQQLFLKHHIKNELRITDGGHDWQCWQNNFTDALVSIFSEK